MAGLGPTRPLLKGATQGLNSPVRRSRGGLAEPPAHCDTWHVSFYLELALGTVSLLVSLRPFHSQSSNPPSVG